MRVTHPTVPATAPGRPRKIGRGTPRDGHEARCGAAEAVPIIARPEKPVPEGRPMATTEAAPLDAAKLEQFVFRAVDEVGATLNAALVVMGDRLGLYRALAGAGPLTPAELAERTGTAERYVREWLNAQAAGGYVAYEPADGRYTCRPSRPSR